MKRLTAIAVTLFLSVPAMAQTKPEVLGQPRANEQRIEATKQIEIEKPQQNAERQKAIMEDMVAGQRALQRQYQEPK